jgi:integrase
MEKVVTTRRAKEKLTVKRIEQWLRGADRHAGQKLSDGGGLYLTSMPSGGASWQVRYAYGGKSATYSIGSIDDVSLAQARTAKSLVRAQVEQGLDPVRERRAKRAERIADSQQTFADVAAAWLEKQKGEWAPIHFTKSKRALERDVMPTLGKLPVSRISTSMVAGVIERIQKRGVRDTTQKILQHVRSVFRFAQAKGLRLDNPAEPVIEILERAPDVVHHPALLTFQELGDVLRRAEVAAVTPGVRLAHRLIAFTGTRIGNVVAAKWAQFDLEDEPACWRIPRGEMKVTGGGRVHDHRVILPKQIASELRRWKLMQPEDSLYLFPGHQGRSHLSRESLEKALRDTMGLAGKHSPHGWRSALSTRAREDTDFDAELIDLSLDHVHASDVALAYDRGQRLAKRVALMTWWGNALELAEAGQPVPTMARERGRFLKRLAGSGRLVRRSSGQVTKSPP